ncbi:MAG: SIP domain-containing protein [Pseudomonadota bacterium]
MSEHSAHISAPPENVFDAVEALARKNGFEIDRTSASLAVTAALGRLRLEAAGSGTEVFFSADSPAQLQILKDLYAVRFANMGFGDSLRWATVAGNAPLNQILARVVESRRISPNFIRLRLSGDFAAFAQPGAGLHFRLLFGPKDTAWPTLDERGITSWPQGVENWHRPSYTVRQVNTGADLIDIDVYLNPTGRAARWCKEVTPGTEIALHGPSGSAARAAGWFGLVGDETALPVIVRILESAPREALGRADIVLRDLDDAQQITAPPGIEIAWHAAVQVPIMSDLVGRFGEPKDNGYAFFAAERAEAGRARARLKEMGWSPRNVTAASYWTAPAGLT